MQSNSSKNFNIVRINFIVYFLLAISLCIFLLSNWFSWETRQAGARIDDLKEEESVLENEISRLDTQVTRLQSPEHVSKIAEQLNMIRAEEPPIILEAD